jgi:hypothetical protein
MKKEIKTIKTMIKIYCKAHHNPEKIPCKECKELLEYAVERLSDCPFQSNKPTCKNCTVHCYKEPYKSQIRKVMRYSGPRILFSHPIIAIRHIFNGFKKSPKLKGEK